jgi:PST family polysaccharide transporter
MLDRVAKQPWKHILNGSLMLVYRLSGAVAGFFIFALSMRKYGPDILGKYAYAFAVCQLIAPLLISGIDPMLVRELVRRPDDTQELLGSAFFLVLLSTLGAAGIPFLYVLTTNFHDKDLIYMVGGLSASMIPNCIFVIMSFLRAKSRITLATTCGLAGVLTCALTRLALVLLGKPMYFVTAAAVLDPLIAGGMMWAAYRRDYGSVFDWRVSVRSMKQLMQLSWSAVLASFVGTLYFRISHLMLKSLSTFDQLGYYAVAFQMFTVLNFLPNSILSVIYPRLVQLHRDNLQRYTEAVRKTYMVITLGGLVVCAAVFLLISPIVALAFGPKSAPVAPIAIAMAVANLFIFSGSVRHQVIYIEHKPIYHVYNTGIGICVLIPLNLLLIPYKGALGASISVAVACLFSAVLSSWIIPALRQTGIDQSLAFLGMRRKVGP